MSLYKENLEDVYIPEIDHIKFSLMNPDELRKTPEIINHNLYMTSSDSNVKSYPEIGGLYDTRMGVIDNNLVCESCKNTNQLCPGHLGHIKLVKPVFYMHFMTRLLKVLRCICYKCSKLLISENASIFKSNITNHLKFDKILLECKKVKQCGEKNEGGCGTVVPRRYYKQGIGDVFAEWKTTDKETNKVLLDADMVLCILKNMRDRDIELLTFDPIYSRPEWMICSIFPVSPPSVRPSIRQDNNQRSDDDLTYKLIEIIKTNSKIDMQIKEGKSDKSIESYVKLLQYHIGTLINNEAPFGPDVPVANVQRSKRQLKSLTERIKSKEGRIRGNLMGKRVDYSARSVITPDPTIRPNELGVPLKIAKNLTYPEKVYKNNINKLKKLILNGPDKYPGAKKIVKSKYGNTKDLNYVNLQQIANDLEIGDIVHRHLEDGDIVLFNRQPSLHKMSMMGHYVRVMPGLTFRLNVASCTPYNADFDGDEMNMHVPQSLECVSELIHIANVNNQIINPRNSAPVISLIQDPKLAIYKITMENENLGKTKLFPEMENKYYFNRKYFMDLMIYNNNFTNIKQIPDDNVGGYFTGEQILSSILPEININKSNYKIVNGILNGTIQKNDSEIIHKINNNLGKNEASNFIHNVQNVLNQYLSKSGFSVGISDLIVDNKIKKDIKHILKEKVDNVDKILYDIQNGLLEKKYYNNLYDEFELLVNKELNTAVDIAGNLLLENLNPVNNRFVTMATAGSKGQSLNLSQMIACVGQQNLEGKRVPDHFNNRTLPHFPQFDNSALSKGFVMNSFYEGLNVFEYFFHAMGGREGLIDTAVKTSETGYIQRKLIKAMEDIKICYDTTVRNHNNHIIQFQYGDDNISPTKLEYIKLNKEVYCDILEFENMYKNFINDNLKYVLEKDIYKNVMENGDDELFDKYYDDLLNSRIFLLELFGTDIENELLVSPVNIDNLIINNINLFNLNKNLSDISPLYVINNIYNLINEFRENVNNKIFFIILMFKLSPYNIIAKYHLTKLVFDKLMDDIKKIYYNSFIDAGTMVGTIAAQAIGEQCTQMTLNTFHTAGVSANSSVIQGLPRLKELLNLSKNLRGPSVSIVLNKKNLDILEIKNIENNIIVKKIKDIIISSSIYFDPDDANSVVPEDRDMIDNYIEFQKQFNIDNIFENNIKRCPFVLRLELDKYYMVRFNMSMNDIYNKIILSYGSQIDIIYSDNNDDNLIFRIKFKEELNEHIDYIDLLKKLENNILKINLNGINNITNTNINKIKNISVVKDGVNKGTIEQYEDIIIQTTGTNLLDIINLDYVDEYNTVTNHINEFLQMYGIEATKQLLIDEMINTLKSGGADVNIRHVILLINIMTYKGHLMSIDRFGIKDSDYGIFSQSSFEESIDLLARAGIFSEVDHVKGVSGNIIMGQKIKGGTGSFKLLFDEVKYFSNFNKIYNTKTDLDVFDIDNLKTFIDFSLIDTVNLNLPEINVSMI